MTTIKRKTFDELAAVLKDNWYSDTEHVWNSIVVDIANVLNTNCLTFKRDKFLSACGYHVDPLAADMARDLPKEAYTSPLEVNPDWVAWHNRMHELAAQMHKLEVEQPTPKSWDAAVDYVMEETLRDYPASTDAIIRHQETLKQGWDAIEANDPVDPDAFHARLNPTGKSK